ncbi:Spo0E family sporulation regulatory protein-aspartic acid phosphatase [Bacillus sp. sid0103]|uniref:Spo0E family sporulation regulatory protein-aspartic acid phosphatase n=1 Tax=Bacillus sp. sid0103 TaxID=2856337 RepID=UPI001C48FC42|nr:Spo0E family sporulation regulatory protein-aspartic acid phosphatase [Bacillus sp. sid0103]MBV7504320.1 Spo0E family sporulation regulatory protein-aspartic acid phosphatase [Bacillus sp. sid0103]
MKTIEMENMELLQEIVALKTKLQSIYKQVGPSSSEYITLSIKLNLLMNKYFEEKAEELVSI